MKSKLRLQEINVPWCRILKKGTIQVAFIIDIIEVSLSSYTGTSHYFMHRLVFKGNEGEIVRHRQIMKGEALIQSLKVQANEGDILGILKNLMRGSSKFYRDTATGDNERSLTLVLTEYYRSET